MSGMPFFRRWIARMRSDRDAAASSLTQDLTYLGQVLVGIALLLVGSAMVFTLWLLPVGLPLAALGVALLAAPRDA